MKIISNPTPLPQSQSWPGLLSSSAGLLLLLALVRLLLHGLINGQYGFHRDELATLDDARYLDWGYVAYPPLTPFLARLALELFGPSLTGLRLFSALAQSLVMVLAGLIARELGGSRPAQLLSAVAVAIAPISLIQGSMFQYVSFDYLWWVLLAYLVIRLLKSEDPRWWLGIGAVIGLGMLTKYTIIFLVAGLVIGVILTPARRYLASPWLWGGVAVSLLIFLPNFIWQFQHGFISLEFLNSIHERDVRIGRTEEFLSEQFIVCANLFTLPLWLAGLYFYFFKKEGRPYRLLGWLYLLTFGLFFVAQGRSYYLAPAYPMLIVAGAVVWEGWLAALPARPARLAWGATWGALAVGGLLFGALVLPIAPVNSGLWNVSRELHDNFTEQIGWPELAETVAGIYTALPETEKSQTGILAGNYGEAGALNLYGPAYGLPEAISGTNSYWLRGYGEPPPQTLIVLGFTQAQAEQHFNQCELAGQVTNRYGVENEETTDHPDIFICRGLRRPWSELWPQFRRFG